MKLPAHLVVAFLFVTLPSAADTLVVEALKDNTLWNNPNGTTSSGAGPQLFVGRSGFMTPFPIKRGLVAFDLSAIPPGSRIDSVELSMVVAMSHGPFPIELHRALSDWGQGGSVSLGGAGAAAQPGDATWLHTFFPGSFWNTPGGDFAALASATLASTAVMHTWTSTPALVADVQVWIDDPSQNFGWLLLGDEVTMQSVKAFHTVEALIPAQRPMLRVDYTVTFCTAKVTTCGAPVISSSGSASATSGSGFVVNAGPARSNRSGLLLYNTSQTVPGLSFEGGTLCVSAMGLRRGGSTNSGGTCAPADCTGVMAIDMNQFAVGAWVVPLPCGGPPIAPNNPAPYLQTAGTTIHAQFWGRHSPGVSLVSGGITWTIGP